MYNGLYPHIVTENSVINLYVAAGQLGGRLSLRSGGCSGQVAVAVGRLLWWSSRRSGAADAVSGRCSAAAVAVGGHCGRVVGGHGKDTKYTFRSDDGARQRMCSVYVVLDGYSLDVCTSIYLYLYIAYSG